MKVDKRTCTECGKTKEIKRNFYSANSIKAIDGRLMVCRACMLKKITNDDDIEVVKAVLREFNIPYVAQYWRSAQKRKGATLGLYLGAIAGLPQVKNVSESMTEDEIRETTSEGYRESDFEGAEEFIVTRDMVDYFGSGFSKTEYKKMIQTFERYCEIYPSDLPAQRSYYKYIAITDVQASKAIKEGNMQVFNKCMDTYSKLHADAKIKPVQDVSAEDKFGVLGTFIQKIEEEEPIPEPLPQFKDVDKIRYYIETFFTKHIKKVFGIGSDDCVL